MNEKFRDNFSKIMFIAVAIIIGACMFSLCLDSGCSIAENEYQISQGVQLDRYYKSLGDDKSIL
ncbi:MAG: hypothetical protein HUK15_07915, partial [Bacteroidales bacterium]|nr:hypothetical protein [Bacteroidales bacterium]